MATEMPETDDAQRETGARTGSASDFMRLALDAFEAGQHGRAESILAQISAQMPEDGAPWYLRGVNAAARDDLVSATGFFINAVKRDTENPKYCAALAETLMRRSMDDAALESWQRTVHLSPENADYQSTFAACLARVDRHRDALPHFAEAARLDPDNLDRIIAYGIALSKAGDHNAAIETLQDAQDRLPDDASVFFHLGLVSQRAGRANDAADAYRKALALDPSLVEARLNLAVCLRDLGDLDQSIDFCEQVLREKPDSVSALNNLGVALSALGRDAEAIVHYRSALLLEPKNTTTLHNLGVALQAEGALDAAEQCLRKCLLLHDNWHEAQRSLANLLRSAGALDEAAELYQAVIDSRPMDFKSYANLGLVLLNLNRAHDAITIYEKALALEPDHPDLQTGLGIAQLTIGDFGDGWKNYDARLRMSQTTAWRPGHGLPTWQGEWRKPETDQPATVLIHAEQGFGDTLQFSRYLPMVQALGVSVVFECQPAIRSLMESLQSPDSTSPLKLIEPGDPMPDCDYHLPLLSLPGRFESNLEALPADVPYLSAPPDKRVKFDDIGRDGSMAVGLVWQGNPSRQDDVHRSCPLNEMAPIAELTEVEFVSLQKDVTQDRFGNVRNLGDQLTDFADTAAIVERLDLVVTVDTAVAHLAGALGRPVWVMLGYAADWRYLLDREDSPWYPSMRLFRQAEPGDWASVTRRIASELERLAEGASTR